MKKIFAVGVGIVILVAIFAAVFLIRLPAAPKENVEDQAYAVLNQELEQAIASITEQDIENALLS